MPLDAKCAARAAFRLHRTGACHCTLCLLARRAQRSAKLREQPLGLDGACALHHQGTLCLATLALKPLRSHALALRPLLGRSDALPLGLQLVAQCCLQLLQLFHLRHLALKLRLERLTPHASLTLTQCACRAFGLEHLPLRLTCVILLCTRSEHILELCSSTLRKHELDFRRRQLLSQCVRFTLAPPEERLQRRDARTRLHHLLGRLFICSGLRGGLRGGLREQLRH
mmetsp:Transcript_41422/g.121117  ORF Transcript_41422/g.121117 Transcript_41422/m.121117 type:complete len:227 (+) Transcript_41422:398-1078(+)